jgi:hypothetical protein
MAQSYDENDFESVMRSRPAMYNPERNAAIDPLFKDIDNNKGKLRKLSGKIEGNPISYYAVNDRWVDMYVLREDLRRRTRYIAPDRKDHTTIGFHKQRKIWEIVTIKADNILHIIGVVLPVDTSNYASLNTFKSRWPLSYLCEDAEYTDIIIIKPSKFKIVAPPEGASVAATSRSFASSRAPRTKGPTPFAIGGAQKNRSTKKHKAKSRKCRKSRKQH